MEIILQLTNSPHENMHLKKIMPTFFSELIGPDFQGPGYFFSELTQPNFWVLKFCHACQFSYEPSTIPIGQVVQAQELFQWKNP